MAGILIPGCSALYAFDGFPLESVSQGEVNGHVMLYEIMGLDNPPKTLEFDIPEGSEIQWARTYIAVWGGTPRYTGWVQLVANDKTFDKVTLYGQDDKTQNVWCTGYGVYWTAWDTQSDLKTGHNVLVATTSQGEASSKLDGRIYGVMTVVVLKDSSGADTKYWITEGNVNLHGTGWTAGANPTVNDNTSVSFSVPSLSGSPHANLTIIELTSTRGLPDYVQFNGQDLGPEATGSAYVAGEKDIADEQSFNDGYRNPSVSRYWDTEVFDVTSLVKSGTNKAVFLRGKDMSWDSTTPVTYTYNGTSHTGYVGNSWGSSYTGTDAGGDGIGDTSFTVPDSLGTDTAPLMEPVSSYSNIHVANPPHRLLHRHSPVGQRPAEGAVHRHVYKLPYLLGMGLRQ